ncbi:MAG: TfoX/Sxy family protein [Patescibacteria group bacterium]
MIKLTPYVEYLLQDVFSDLDDVSVKRMFGGYGYYLGGSIFAFSGPDDGLMFKANDMTKQQYIDMGSEQFVYTGHKNKGPVKMPYWTVPEDLLEDRSKIAELARQSASLS